jgi:hypothetical protein
MTHSLEKPSLQQTIAAIQSLDLGPIKFKATRGEDGYGWSAEHVERVELAYRRYLILHAMHPQLNLAPERDVDRFWHLHILDTRKYASDCEAMFGGFLHHFPYFGLRGEDDARALQDAFAQTQALYARTFGEPLPALQSDKAWCSVESDGPSAAWCSVESPPARAAWRSVESRPVRAAWCSVEAEAPARAAWCSVESTAPAAA